ncbi:MAG: hypothetical protein JXJ04_15950 [Spirochaetales bacterium]|nr:hypothetical protein [Spirochaetales bacterium]
MMKSTRTRERPGCVRNRGEICIDAVPGRGTQFTITIVKDKTPWVESLDAKEILR